MAKTQIDIAEVQKLMDRLRAINSVPFDDIEWVNNGQMLTVDPKVAADWKFMGLSNAHFIAYGHPILKQCGINHPMFKGSK